MPRAALFKGYPHYFEDYPDRQLPLDVSLRTKRNINETCRRDIQVLGTTQSGLAIPLIPLFNQSYDATGFALMEKYVVNGKLTAFPGTISDPTKIRFTFSLDRTTEIATLEFVMTRPANLPKNMTSPVFAQCIYPEIVLIESRVHDTDNWQVVDEFNLHLLNVNAPRRFTNFKYCTYRRPARQLRFTVQSLTNYTVLQPNGRYDISRSHFYFPQILAYENPPEKTINR